MCQDSITGIVTDEARLAAAAAATDAGAVAVLADRFSAWVAWRASKDKPSINMLTDGVSK